MIVSYAIKWLPKYFQLTTARITIITIIIIYLLLLYVINVNDKLKIVELFIIPLFQECASKMRVEMSNSSHKLGLHLILRVTISAEFQFYY